MSETNCPFYGRALVRAGDPFLLPFLLFVTDGNQCALLNRSHSPCAMEMNGLAIDWRQCALVNAVTFDPPR